MCIMMFGSRLGLNKAFLTFYIYFSLNSNFSLTDSNNYLPLLHSAFSSSRI